MTQYTIEEQVGFKEQSKYRLVNAEYINFLGRKVARYKYYINKHNELCEYDEAFVTTSKDEIEEFKKWCEDDNKKKI